MNYLGNSLCFDDILLIPQYGNIKSRSQVNISMKVNSLYLEFPVIASPMDTVCGIDMCMSMSSHGGIGILHRYMSFEDQIIASKILVDSEMNFGVAVGLDSIDHVTRLYDCGVRCILVDTANGHNFYSIDEIRKIRKQFSDIHIMAGNISTQEGFARLAQAGANSIRVGIGGGACCTTRMVTGHGIPTLASIMKCKTWKDENSECAIIADGGIRSSGDIVKAFAAGADAVMLGSMLAATDCSPGNIEIIDGLEVKTFRGMASLEAQKQNNKISVIEGVSSYLPYKGSLNDVVGAIKGGIASGCSYSGVDRLDMLHKSASYVTVSPASISESMPHALK